MDKPPTKQYPHPITAEHNQYKNITILTTVTKCLTQHDNCSAKYLDYGGRFLINCSCECHAKRDKDALS